jgi:hypothetical protein
MRKGAPNNRSVGQEWRFAAAVRKIFCQENERFIASSNISENRILQMDQNGGGE